MKIKICGITRVEDAIAAGDAGADFLGLIMAESPRRITPEQASHIAAAAPAGARPVLLFRNQPFDDILSVVEDSEFGWVQLHGAESPTLLRDLHGHLPELHVIRAWEVTDDYSDARRLDRYLTECWDLGARVDVVILDVPKGAAHPGVAALASVARHVARHPVDIWCAGGLTPENVAEAIACGVFKGVDVARGVEVEPGVKSREAITSFVSAVRGAEARI